MPGVGNYIISITFYMSQRQVSLCRNLSLPRPNQLSIRLLGGLVLPVGH